MSTTGYEKTMPPPASAGALVGTVLAERYRIDSLLGEGGMGAVYLGEHLLMHKRVAVKVLHPEMLDNAEVVERFEREAMAAAHIDHANVASASDFGKLPDGSFFLVLEFLEGKSLREAMDQQGAFPLQRALHVTRQIASALTRAHALGIVHRDLKPDNVMLVQRDADPDFAKVLDFGIAKVPVHELAGKGGQAKAGLTQLGVMYGTPEYMAPEQALGLAIDARADLYALGVTVYEMLAGELPFVSEDRVSIVTMHVTTPPPPLRTRAPDVPPDVEDLVMQLLAKDPRQRVQQARDVIERIDAIVGQGRRVAVPASGTRPAMPASSPLFSAIERAQSGLPPPLRDLPPGVLVAIAGVLLLGGGVVFLAVLVFAFHGSSPSSVEVSPTGKPVAVERGSVAPDATLRDARLKGVNALTDLATQYPNDVRIGRALVVALGEEKRRVDAMRELGHLLDRDKAAADDESLLRAVRASAEDPDAADLAFELMEGPLGGRGSELLFDLTSSQRAGPRASKSLSRPEIRARSPAVAIALDFKNASTCEAKKALLGRVRDQGDRRVLGAVKSLRVQSGCGFLRRSDCWPCLRQGSELPDALREVEARSESAAAAGSSQPP
jgi:eukaryotic-like serine/threonine-protein kinase